MQLLQETRQRHNQSSIYMDATLSPPQKGKFLTWTGINNKQLLKHICTSIATSLGYLDQECKNFQLKNR